MIHTVAGDLRFRTAAEVLALVESGECELGVVYLTKVSNHLSFRPIYDEELALIAAPKLELEGRNLRSLSAYETLPFVTYLEGDYVFGKWFETIFGAQPRATTSVHHYDELEEVVDSVALGRGVSIVPADSARDAVRRRRVRIIRPVRGKRCINRVFAVTRAGAFPRAEAEEILGATGQ